MIQGAHLWFSQKKRGVAIKVFAVQEVTLWWSRFTLLPSAQQYLLTPLCGFQSLSSCWGRGGQYWKIRENKEELRLMIWVKTSPHLLWKEKLFYIKSVRAKEAFCCGKVHAEYQTPSPVCKYHWMWLNNLGNYLYWADREEVQVYHKL